METYRAAQRAEGPAAILAIGSATPPHFILQSEYPDFYFRVTNREDLPQIKEKFRRMCEGIEDKETAYLSDRGNTQDIAISEVPKLGVEAALLAIKEWAQPKSRITHLIFCTTSGVDMPGADYRLTKLLGLNPFVNRFMLYQQGCFAGGTVLRLAKDIAENNRGARVLVVCSEITVMTFRGPTECLTDYLVGQALFGDGAAAVVVGADPDPVLERPLFSIISAFQALLPDSECAIEGHFLEAGLIFHLLKDVPEVISKNVKRILEEAFYDSVFLAAHPGGPAILNRVEEKLGLGPDKLRATRHVLAEYGNMSSACILFILDELRKSSVAEGKETTGEGLDWGVLFGFGPGLTFETVVLRSAAIAPP